MSCPTCIPLDCALTEDTDLYSLQEPIFPFVLNCPPGFDCNEGTQFQMVCCGQLLSAQFPPNATVDDKLTIIQDIVNQCGVRQLYCGDNPTTQLYYNAPKQCTVNCSDGNPFSFTVPAGTFAASTQTEADNNAQSFACLQADLRKVCLGRIPGCACVGVAYAETVPSSGGIPPFTWSVFSGSLPPGLSLASGVISGTPTTAGIYAFVIQVTEPDGSFIRKPYSITCLRIATASLPAYTIGVPYSYQLQAVGGSGNYAWKITSGTLPNGLTMSVSGLISGIPT